ncbi:gibberellin 3-beta-dioxygenase 3-like [Rutidosis leptorrhynchoides]|uniref:gibberellin 3-beta-dioxygenase 3-like n=1 Tax=Rutidosis leptorrhynchoides TaxID=125765 RepID=UPI003A99FCBC
MPESHSWNGPATKEDNLPVIHEQQVPIIDLADPRADELIRNACEKWGVFRVINHGIPLDLLAQAENQTMKLFSLPADRKIKAARAPSSHGGTGYGLLPVSPMYPDQPWNKGFSIMSTGSPLMEQAIKLWPDHEQDRTTFCNVLAEYQKEMKVLAEKLISLMMNSLGICLEENFKWLNPNKNGDGGQYLG